MPLYHVSASYIKHGTSGGASGFSHYLNRENQDNASQFHRYLDRENGQIKDDLVAQGSANLPAWAHESSAAFWKAADTYERKDYVVARHLQISLPRELSRAHQLDLAEDIREVVVGRFSHSWAAHDPEAKDGSGSNPHLHILFSERREDIPLQRTSAEWFAKAADHDKDPQTGGVRKDRSWQKKGHLYDIRDAVALLTNAALAREGVAAAVDARSLGAQGIDRSSTEYANPHDKQAAKRVTDTRQALRDSGVTADEQSATYARWQQQAATLPSLDRAYMVDRCRYHLWRYDTSPSRLTEREASIQRIDVVIANTKGPKHPVAYKTSMSMRRGQEENNAQGHILAPDLSHAREKAQGLSW